MVKNGSDLSYIYVQIIHCDCLQRFVASLKFANAKIESFLAEEFWLPDKGLNMYWKLVGNTFQNVTGPAKIRHICTHNLALFLNFNLQYLLKHEWYDNKIFMSYSQINKKVNKSYRT